jgi:hypothetical protein
MYGGLKPATTNVLYIHGSIDRLTLTNEKQTQPTIFIEGASHCAEMDEPSEKDSPQMMEARKEKSKFIEALLD